MINIRKVALALVAWVVAMIVIAFATAAPSSADSNSYFTEVAEKLKTNPVFVDPSANPSITPEQAETLREQINNTNRDIYVVFVDKAQVGNMPSDQVPGAVHTAMEQSGVYAVSTGNDFYAQGFDVPTPIAEKTPELATKALNDSKTALNGKATPYDVFVRFIASVNNVQVPTNSPIQDSPAPASTQVVENEVNWTLIVVGSMAFALITVIVCWLLANRNSKKHLREQAAARVATTTPRTPRPSTSSSSRSSTTRSSSSPSSSSRRSSNDSTIGYTGIVHDSGHTHTPTYHSPDISTGHVGGGDYGGGISSGDAGGGSYG